MSGKGGMRGARAGAVAGLGAVAAMYAAGLLTGVRSLPELLQAPILAVLPGPLFGFLIDTLQHAGKVIEEAGLIAAMVLVLAGLGAAAGLLSNRRSVPRAGLLAGAVGWLLVTLVLLPLVGEGALGLRRGLAEPVVWAIVFTVYALLWDALWSRRQDAPFDAGRRRVVALLPAGVVLGSLAIVGYVRAPGWVRDVLAPPEAGLVGPVPEITPVANFYVVSKNFADPVVDTSGWALRVTGQVERPLRLDHRALQALPSTTEIVTLACVSNNVGGDLMSTSSFTGVPLRDLIAMAGPRPAAMAAVMKARDGYTETVGLKLVIETPEILVAYALGGRPLPDKHGFPARIVIPGHYGMRGPKWLDEVELTTSESGGYWEAQGWDHRAVVKTTARFDVPRDGAIVRAGAVQLAGVAFAGVRGVQAVEWSADGGRTWASAEVQPAPSPLAWSLWRATWMPRGEGAHTLQLRARDGKGEWQTPQVAPSFPSGASGYHTIQVSVGR